MRLQARGAGFQTTPLPEACAASPHDWLTCTALPSGLEAALRCTAQAPAPTLPRYKGAAGVSLPLYADVTCGSRSAAKVPSGDGPPTGTAARMMRSIACRAPLER